MNQCNNCNHYVPIGIDYGACPKINEGKFFPHGSTVSSDYKCEKWKPKRK